MSLQVSLEILGATQDELKALSGQLPKAGKLSFRPEKDGLFFWKWKGFEVKGVNDGLSENVSAKSDYLPLNAETTTSLTELLVAFTKLCPRRFSLYAAISGDLPKRDTDVEVDELLELVAGGYLGNRVKYQVRPTSKRVVAEEIAPE